MCNVGDRHNHAEAARVVGIRFGIDGVVEVARIRTIDREQT